MAQALSQDLVCTKANMLVRTVYCNIMRCTPKPPTPEQVPLALGTGTGDYISYGHGGAMVARDGDPNSLPIAKGELIYTGRYAGIRVVEGNNDSGDVSLVRGDAKLAVDLRDFDITGSIIGSINNRTVYDVNGNLIGSLGVIGINQGAEISADGRITGGTATSYSLGHVALGTGTFEGLFAGPNGEEIVGAIIIVEDNGGTGTQETGVLTVVD